MLSTTNNMDPTIEVYDPNGTRILNGAANGASCSNFGCSFSVDLFPMITGTYSLVLYDLGTNEAGGYQLGLQCVFSPGDFVCDDITTTPPVGDNCSVVANPSQLDTDTNTGTDGYGNMCDGDLNNDGDTNTLDLNIYKAAHRSKLGDPNYNPDADFNGDGQINTLDLNIYKGLHRKPPGPSGLVP